MKFLLGIDTETTGISSEDEVIQLAAIHVNPETFEVEDEFSTLVYTDREIHPMAQQVHGISKEMLHGYLPMNLVLQTQGFGDLFKGSEIVFGHNLSFDLRMIKKHTDSLESKQVLDTLTLVRRLFPQWNNHKLQTAVSLLNLPQRSAHDALGDILSCADIMKHLHNNMGLSLNDMLEKSSNLKAHFLNLVKGL